MIRTDTRIGMTESKHRTRIHGEGEFRRGDGAISASGSSPTPRRGRHTRRIRRIRRELEKAQVARVYVVKHPQELPPLRAEDRRRGWSMKVVHQSVLSQRGGDAVITGVRATRADPRGKTTPGMFCVVWHSGTRDQLRSSDLEPLEGAYHVDHAVGRWISGLNWVSRDRWDRVLAGLHGDQPLRAGWQETVTWRRMGPWRQLLRVRHRRHEDRGMTSSRREDKGSGA